MMLRQSFFISLAIAIIPVSAQVSTGRYALILEDEPLAVRSVAAGNSPQRIEARQQSLRNQLVSKNIRVLSSAQTLVNAVFVTAPKDRLDELRALPGVKAVVPVRRYEPKLSNAVKLIDVPAA